MTEVKPVYFAEADCFRQLNFWLDNSDLQLRYSDARLVRDLIVAFEIFAARCADDRFGHCHAAR